MKIINIEPDEFEKWVKWADTLVNARARNLSSIEAMVMADDMRPAQIPLSHDQVKVLKGMHKRAIESLQNAKRIRNHIKFDRVYIED